MREEPAAWIWWEFLCARKTITVRLAGSQFCLRSRSKGMGALRGTWKDWILRRRRTTGACCREWPEFSPAVTSDLRFFSVTATQSSKEAPEGSAEGFSSRETAKDFLFVGLAADGVTRRRALGTEAAQRI